MSLFVSADEIHRITGRRRYSAQRKALDSLGIRYIVAKSGEPLVRRDWRERQIEATNAKITERGRLAYARLQARDRRRAAMWRPVPLDDVIASRRPYSPGGGPRVGGIYFLFDGDVLTYVGKSFLISDRLWQHVRAFRRFDAFAYVACPSARADEAEIHYIRAARPRDNVAYNGEDGWRPELASDLPA